MEAVDVLEDVRLTVGDQNNVQLVQWLVHEAHVVLLDDGMLGARIREFGERGQQGFNSRPSNFTKLARENSLASASTYRRRKNDLLCVGMGSVSVLTVWKHGTYHGDSAGNEEKEETMIPVVRSTIGTKRVLVE